VGSYPAGASAYGVMDMAGNVEEWVNDWYSDIYYKSSPASNPTGPATGTYRVLRGGDWYYNAGSVYVASRTMGDPTDKNYLGGFRCADSGSDVTPPNELKKISPANSTVNHPISLTLDWEDSSRASSYVYCYDATNDNACSNWLSTGTASQVSLSGLSANTTYYWQARATNIAGTTYANGSASAFWSFTTSDGTVIPGEMIVIPAGSFQMGCDPDYNGGYSCDSSELPLHTVSLDAYRIDKYEVTNAQYAQCVATGDCTAPTCNYSRIRASYYDNPTYANYPVIQVSWQDASNYCDWAGKRLPTEAEWERAARGTTLIAYPWGVASPTCSLVNGYISSPCVYDTSAVGSNPGGASPYGVLDMAGNVWEWVADLYSASYYSISPSSNPQGPDSGTDRVLRGGSWNSTSDYLRVADRDVFDPTHRDNNVGFRCAASDNDVTQPSGFTKTSPASGATSDAIDLIMDWEDSSGATSYAYCYDTTNDNACSNWISTGTTSQAALLSWQANTNTTIYWQARATNSVGTTYANGSASAFWSFTTGDGTIMPGEMVAIPAGSFQMGCDPDHNGGYYCDSDELPLHTITLDAYRIDKYEVTNAQYAQCVAAGECVAPLYSYSD